MVAKTVPLDALSEDVLKFAQDNCIVEYVEKAIQAARDVFADAERISVSLKRDPEFGSHYVDISAMVHDDPESEAEKYSTCMGKWVVFMPPSVGEKIQLSTSWAD